MGKVESCRLDLGETDNGHTARSGRERVDGKHFGTENMLKPVDAAEAPAALAGPEISVVIPTFNESGNIAELVRRIAATLAGVAWEVVVVDDDSADGTADIVDALARRDHRVRCIRRIGRRGLSSACIEGFLSSSAPYLAVIDGDLQHDETLLATMLDRLRSGDVDVVVGSRYVAGGGIGDWDPRRAQLSRLSTALAKRTLRVVLSDPMSGFFAIRREVVHDLVRDLSGVGFKILLDIFATAPRQLRVCELPYEFRARRAGESKVDGMVALDFLTLLLQKRVGRFIPSRFIYFSLVGGTGVLVHLAVLSIAYKGLAMPFWASQTVATVAAMVGNFTLNNLVTYRDQRLSGLAWWRGLLMFSVACSVGAIANVGVASYIFGGGIGWLPSALAGVVVGTVWNYATTAFYVWRLRK
jgi:dolichol-phosphate mannosyltransferase